MTAATGPERALLPHELRRLGRAVPRRLRFTRDGKLLFFITLGIGFGAVNSGNNLLYLVLGVLLSLIMVSGVLSELALRRLTARRSETALLHVGEPSLVRVDILNRKRRLNTLSVEVTELVDPDYGLEQRRGFVLGIQAGEEEAAHLRVQGNRRGVIPTGGLRLTTRFPFGFFEKSSFLPLAGRYVVAPALKPTPRPPLAPRIRGNEEEVARVGHGDEFYALRDAQPGEDSRTIAWKVTARRDKLTMREHQRPATRKVTLQVANVIPRGVDGAEDRAEEAFSRVASLARLLIDEGYAVGLATCDGGVRPESGAQALRHMLEHLATLVIRECSQGEVLPAFPVWDRSETLTVVTVDQQEAGFEIQADAVLLVGSDEEQESP